MKFGLPTVQNHSVKEYKAGAQNWDIEYYNGHVYFANNDGLLTYNGQNWQTYHTPNETIIRSLSKSKDGRIYVGAQNELGYFKDTSTGGLEFYSILNDSLVDFNEIWYLECLSNEIYFSNKLKIFKEKNGFIHEIKGVRDIEYMTQLNNSIWFKSGQSGLKRIQNGIVEDIPNTEILQNKSIVSICLAYNDDIYIATTHDGIYLYQDGNLSKWKTNCDDFLKKSRVSTLTYSDTQGLLIGTDLAGMANIDSLGQAVMHIDKSKGLHNNSISCSKYDEFGNLWLGLYNGIDEVNMNQSLYKFFPDNELQGAVYDLDRWEGKLFFSTSNGLFYIEEKSYYSPFKNDQFKLVKGTQDQAWSTDIIKGQLYCNHHNGVFQVNKDMTIKTIKKTGAWKFEPLQNDTYALGHYTGISIYKLDEKNKLEYSHEVKDITESCRVLIFDKHQNLWISHPYKNIFKINFSKDYTQSEIQIFKGENGIIDDLHNYVTNINGNCYSTNKTGVYKYNQTTNHFEQDSILNKLLKNRQFVRRIKMLNKKLWFITDRSTFAYKKINDGLSEKFIRNTTLNLSTKENYIGGFEDIFEMNDQTMIVPTQEGAYYYNIANEKKYNPTITIKNISLPEYKDSIIYHGFGEYPDIALNPSENSLRFSFGLAEPSSNKENLYSTKLKGFENQWSKWHNQNTKEYTNLTDGKYQLLLKTKDSRNIESSEFKLEFEIKTPWYKSLWAACFYITCFLLSLIALIYIPKKKYEKTTARLEDENQTKDEQLNIIKKEKLEDEIKFKNQELASAALHLLQKNQTLTSVKNKINSLKDKPSNAKVKKDLNEIIGIIRSDLRLDEDWSKFSLHFDQVHQDFIKKLKIKYPELSTKDHKLCAFLKMNLSTKEISPLLNISIRGVEISRYRLRKKLNIERAIDLNEFLNEI